MRLGNNNQNCRIYSLCRLCECCGNTKSAFLAKMILTIVCMMSAMCIAGSVQKSSAKKTSLSDSELRTLAKTEPDIMNAGMVYSVAMATTNNVERKQAYLKVAAACLIACGKLDIYQKHVKRALQDAAEFEGELKDDCKQCSGTGKKKRRCFVCSGKGRCSVCKGSGQTRAVKYSGFHKYHVSKPCGKCKSSGRCPKCVEGVLEEKCLTCAGTGKVISQTVARRVWHDSCAAIADSMTSKARVKADAEERERNRKVAEAKAKADAEERERKRKVAEAKAKEEARIEREYMESLGFVNIYGKWMTPGSLRNVRYKVVQIYESGHALCYDGDRVFCLIYSANINRDAAEGDIYVNDLYRCGTFSYTAVNNAPRTVAKFAIDLDMALKEIKKQRP